MNLIIEIFISYTFKWVFRPTHIDYAGKIFRYKAKVLFRSYLQENGPDYYPEYMYVPVASVYPSTPFNNCK